MSRENFERALAFFKKQKPFSHFFVEFDNGVRLEVDHPEALIFHANMLVFRDRQGSYSLFEWNSVTRFVSRPKKGT